MYTSPHFLTLLLSLLLWCRTPPWKNDCSSRPPPHFRSTLPILCSNELLLFLWFDFHHDSLLRVISLYLSLFLSLSKKKRLMSKKRRGSSQAIEASAAAAYEMMVNEDSEVVHAKMLGSAALHSEQWIQQQVVQDWVSQIKCASFFLFLSFSSFFSFFFLFTLSRRRLFLSFSKIVYSLSLSLYIYIYIYTYSIPIIPSVAMIFSSPPFFWRRGVESMAFVL